MKIFLKKKMITILQKCFLLNLFFVLQWSWSAITVQAHINPSVQPHKPMEISWILAHEPSQVFRFAAQNFQNILDKETNGMLKVKIMTLKEYGGMQASYKQLLQDLQSNKIQMTQTYTYQMAQFDKSIYVLDLPFLFKDHEHASRVLDGPLGEKLLSSLVPYNIRGLAFTYSGGYRIIATSHNEINSYEDFKNLKIRTAPGPVTNKMYEKLGAQAIPDSITHGAQLTGDGKIDGLELTYVRYLPYMKKKAPIINETFHTLFLTGILVNETFFQSLSPQFQQALKKAALKAAQDERVTSIKDGEKVKKELKQSGMKVVEMKKIERERFHQFMQPIYAQFADYFPSSMIKDILDLE